MKIKISMMSILDIKHTLEQMGDKAMCKRCLDSINEIFGPLLQECEFGKCPPEFEATVSKLGEISTMDTNITDDSNIDWEHRRYELVKELYSSFRVSHPQFDYSSSSNVKDILIQITREADFILESLKQNDILEWNGTLYNSK